MAFSSADPVPHVTFTFSPWSLRKPMGKSKYNYFPRHNKTFDRAPDARLLLKVKVYELVDRPHSWLTSYPDIPQVLRIKRTQFQPQTIARVVLESSAPGCLLFLPYISDAFGAVSHGTAFLFANGFKPVWSFRTHPTVQDLAKIMLKCKPTMRFV